MSEVGHRGHPAGPAAEQFFAVTLTDPRGVTYRRRYRWSGGRIVDYWGHVLDNDDELVQELADAEWQVIKRR